MLGLELCGFSKSGDGEVDLIDAVIDEANLVVSYERVGRPFEVLRENLYGLLLASELVKRATEKHLTL